MTKKVLKYVMYILIAFFLNITFIMASCTVDYVTCPGSNQTDYIVQPRITKNGKTNQNAYDDATGITFQYWQRDKKPVFCIVKGIRGPMYGAHYPVSGWDKRITCQTKYKFSKNDGKLKAAIGYVIRNYASNALPQQEGDNAYKAYVKVQSLVYKLLYDKNGGEAFNSYDANIYANMLNEYNSYGSESVSISNFTLNLIGDNWEATVPITKKNVDSVSVDSLKKGSTELKQYASISGDNVNISIPASKLSNGNSVTLKLKGTRTYYLADARTCDDNRQPIVTTTTTLESKPTSGSATGTAQKKHTLDINVVVDGELKTSFSSNIYATSNFSVGGIKIWEGSFKDHSKDYLEGSSYSITNISAKDGYEYKGYNVDDHARKGIDSSGNTIEGQINGVTAITLTFETTARYTIKKINSRNGAVKGEVIFNVYSDKSCKNYIEKQIKVTGGSGHEDLPVGTLYIQEQSAPQPYRVDETCKPITVTKEGTNEITITNKTECEYAFELDDSVYNRLNLYKTYGNYKNLLNFDILDSWEACSPYEPNYDPQESCLYADKINIDTENKFTSSDLSDYNDNITSNGAISYCLTDFELESLIGINSPVKAGRLAYGFNDNNDAITGIITKTCYIHQNDIKTFGMEDMIDSSNSNLVLKNLNNNKYYSVNRSLLTEISDDNIILKSETLNEFYVLQKQVINSYTKDSDGYYKLGKINICAKVKKIDNNTKYCIVANDMRNTLVIYGDTDYILYDETNDKYYYIEKGSLDNNSTIISSIISNPQENEQYFDIDYKDYVGNISLNGKNLPVNIDNLFSTPTKEGEFYKIKVTSSALYKLNPISVYKLSGKECDNITDNGCTKIGYGVLSKFVDGKNSLKRGDFDFKITPGANSILEFKEEGNTCTYTVEPEIIKYNADNGKLDLEFRTIDTNNPFNRNTKSNWSYGTDSSQNNKTVQDEIINETNSYGIKNGVGKQTPKYTIKLTPDVVQEIRKDNKIVKYDEYYELCDEGTSCKSKSKFIHDLYVEGVIQ